MLGKLLEKDYSENNLFNIFYTLQTLLMFIGLARGTVFGFIMFKLDVSPFYLSLFFIIGLVPTIANYFLFPFLNRKLKKPILILVFYELICFIGAILALLYTVILYSDTGYGNYWIWGLINFLFGLTIYGTSSIRPIYVNNKFPTYNFKKIIRIDLICLSASKLLGLLVGFFFDGKMGLIYVFLFSIIFSLITIFYYFFLDKVNVKKVIDNIKKSVTKIDVDTYYNVYLTYLLLIIPKAFLTALSAQAVYINKELGVAFYILLLFFAIGNLSFNIILNRNLSLNIEGRFKIISVLTVLAMSSFIFTNNEYIILFSMFILGGSFTTYSNISASRLYSYSVTREAKNISRYQMVGAILNVIGILSFGLLFELTSFKFGFIVWTALTALTLLYIILYNKKYNFDKQRS